MIDRLFYKITRTSLFWAISLLIFFALILWLIIFVSWENPRINSINPSMAYPGETIQIKGKNFSTRENSILTIGGIRPVQSSILKWTDNIIQIKISKNISSGLVILETKHGRANGGLFTNQQDVPVVLTDQSVPGQPRIESIIPPKAEIGQEIIIKGDFFGFSMHNASVSFSSEILSTKSKNMDESTQTFNGPEYCIEKWSNDLIKIRIPDGAVSGHIQVQTAQGPSNKVYLQVEENIGSRKISHKRSYHVYQMLDVVDIFSSGDNQLYIWYPRIATTSRQKALQLQGIDPKPQEEDMDGYMLFQLNNLRTGSMRRIIITSFFDCYNMESDIQTERIKDGFSYNNKLYRKFTSSDKLVSLDNPGLKRIAEAVIGQEENPYFKAKKVFDFLLTKLEYDQNSETDDPMLVLDLGKGNAWSYSLLFCALCRSVKIPSRIVGGYLASESKRIVPHFWTEFYIMGFGWLPVDLILAEKVYLGTIISVMEANDYYFGNLDNRHITISRGLKAVPVMQNGSRKKYHHRKPWLQEHHEESIGALDHYRTNWHNLAVNGIY